MPRKGTKSLYVVEELHTKLKQLYEEKEAELAMKGITTFNGWISYLLLESVEEEVD